jgi:hypothetical protein
MMNKNAWLVVILVVVGLTACATFQSNVKGPSLPNDINIVSPSPDLPKEIAVFSGKWEGTWEWGTSVIIAVEEIHDTWGRIVYAIGDNPRFNVSAGYVRLKAEVIANPKPKIQFGPAIPQTARGISLEVIDSNTLEGNMNFSDVYGNRGNQRGIMKRTN